jgi:hypothetical protein
VTTTYERLHQDYLRVKASRDRFQSEARVTRARNRALEDEIARVLKEWDNVKTDADALETLAEYGTGEDRERYVTFMEQVVFGHLPKMFSNLEKISKERKKSR